MTYKLTDFTIPGTTFDTLLSSSQQPAFVRNSTNFRRCAYRPHQSQVTHPSTGYLTPVGELVTERYDAKDYPKVWNYDRYVIARTSTGGVAQFRPIPSTCPVHRSTAPSTWMNSLAG